MRIIATVLEKSGGSVKVGGIDISQKKKIRSILGIFRRSFQCTVNERIRGHGLSFNPFRITDGRRRKANILKLLEK